ncbi:GntR family transcriptional regulator [Carnobacterium maltaromaticum]|uniref:GntR family transcriptional regulator n=1 Tax=Carnobacterium maltaromaticum TaxID=2751 RepID=UPI0039BE2439
MIIKYKIVYDDLVAQIENNILQEGDTIPSEHHLTEIYKASRDTIRKALSKLNTNGYIYKQQGKNSIVTNRNNWNTVSISKENLSDLFFLGLEKEDIEYILLNQNENSIFKKIAFFLKNNNLGGKSYE